MKKQIFFWSITSSLAGFLFGFDTVVISGAEQTIQRLWGLSAGEHGLVMGSALYGTVAGALTGGWPTDRLGRRKTLLGIGALYVLSAIGCALANGVGPFVAARFLGGLGIGVSTVASPLYISEIAPPSHRGKLAGMFQFNIVFGILAAYASNAFLERHGGAQAWRWMLGVAAFPSLLYSVLCFGLPESPRWLLARRRDRGAGLAALRLIEPEKPAEELEAQAREIELSAKEQERAGGGFWSDRLRKPILLAFLITFFNQLSGINAVLYFAPRIFKMTGLGDQAAMLQSVGIGVTNLVFTFVGLWLIDRAGRRTLLYIGSFGYITSPGLTAWAFFSGHVTIVPACIFAFIASHAVGQGAVIWVFISEIFPNRYRAEGQALGSSTHWVFAALLATFFPEMVKSFSMGAVFLFFCGMMVLQLLWVQCTVPETRGVPLEEMQRRLGFEEEGESFANEGSNRYEAK